MLWSMDRQISPSCDQSPSGYTLRTYQPGDEPGFYLLMDAAGWPGWDDEKLRPWLYRILPGGWFMLVEEKSGEIVASSMATHDPTWQVPFCAELGWVAAHPVQTGRGLGSVVVAAAVACMLQAGYQVIHLYTERWRFAALKTYLKLGFVPYLDPPESTGHWKGICTQLDWPFTPDNWVGRNQLQDEFK